MLSVVDKLYDGWVTRFLNLVFNPMTWVIVFTDLIVVNPEGVWLPVISVLVANWAACCCNALC